MKKILAVLMAAAMIAAATTGCGSSTSSSAAASGSGAASGAASTASAKDVYIGSCIYKFDDTFMTGVRNAMTARANEIGAKLDLVDSQNKQATQSEQVDTYITKGVNALAINPVDLTAAAPLIEKAKAASLPIVFLNRQPSDTDIASYDKAYYVGADAKQSGTMSGEIIADYFKAHKDADKNGDGKIQYVMLQGEPGHQDATLRSQAAPAAIEAAGFQTEALAKDTAYWDKAKATDLMNTWITSVGLNKIEAILANNDDMALGAIEALKAQGYNTGDSSKYIPVVGVDATAPALEAMKDGSMLGTVLNDAKNQAKATVNIAAAAAQGKPINEENVGYKLYDATGKEQSDGHYVWINYVKVTADNYKDYL